MRKFIFAVITIFAFASCNKSKIRTCKITLVDGTKIEKPTPKEMTLSEANEYEKYEMVRNSYQSINCR